MTPEELAAAWAKLVDERDALREALEEIVYYSGGADSALDDEYVMERAVRALNACAEHAERKP